MSDPLAKLIKKLDSGGYATYLRSHSEQSSSGVLSPVFKTNTLYCIAVPIS